MSDSDIAEFVSVFGMIQAIAGTLIMVFGLIFQYTPALAASGALYFLCALCWKFRKKLMRQ